MLLLRRIRIEVCAIGENVKSRRLSDFDVADRFAAFGPALLLQALFGVVCSTGAIITRALVDSFAAAAGPYSLIYPTILIATLFGRWQAGVVTWATSFLFAWYFVLPAHGSFAYEVSGDGARTIVNGAAALVIVIFAEMFRRAVRRAAEERDEEIKARGLLLREIDHRMRNNFSIVESFLGMQARNASNEESRRALGIALGRMHSFASTHKTLYDNYRTNSEASLVEMRAYLGDLTDHLCEALFLKDEVTVKLSVNGARLPREQAAAIGLVLNELVTNAAKHAFGDARGGEIEVTFDEDGEAWRLVVADNGRGYDAADEHRGSGTELIEAFARQAGGAITMESSPAGTRYTLAGARRAAKEVAPA